MKKRCFVILIFVWLLIGIMLFKYKISDNNLVGVYVDNIESSLLPDKDNYVIDKVVCDNEAVGTWDNANWNLLITNLSKKSNCKLYFRSKKEITVTYDNNYIKNNIFDNIYQSLIINRNVATSTNTTFEIKQMNNYNYYKFISNGKENNPEWFSGLFMPSSNKLTSGKKYTITLEAKANKKLNAYIGSEQMVNQYERIGSSEIFENWNKYFFSFNATSNPGAAFVFYGWIVKGEERILEIREISLQEGEYDNFSNINLKEYDTLSNTLPTPTRDNYTFLGWYTDPIEGEKISSGTQVTKDTTYYAHWQYNE